MSILYHYSQTKFYRAGHAIILRLIIVILCVFIMIPNRGYCQEANSYDETSLILNVQRIGSLEIPAIVYKEDAYLSIKDIFDFLKIKNTPSASFYSIDGFFINPKDKFLFDKENNQIVYQGKTFQIAPADMIRTETNLYLKADYFGQVFGLECAFSFRNLSITLTTKSELPAIREMQQEQMRKNISQLKGEKKADTTITQQFSWLHLGVADWSVTSTEETSEKNNTRASLSLGAIIAGGEATANLNYNSSQPFNSKDQYYQWRYVNNEHSALRQITAGRIFTQFISTIYAPVTGIQFTNTPTTYRRSFGTYRISNTTEPGWMVELYVNNVLVNYVKADASGFYTFDVPLVYGNSAIKLRIYGPWGEERTEEQNISVPFNFLPRKQFEYNVSAGIVDDDQKSRFSRASFNYGLNDRITIGGGTEYVSSANSGKPMPFVNASMRLSSQLLVSGEYTNHVRSKATLNYHLPYNLQLDLNYTKYAKGQTAIRFNYLEERKASLSVPLPGKKFSAFSRITFNQFILPKFKYSSAEFLLSAVVLGVSSNLTTSALFTDPEYPYIYSHLSLTFRLPFALRFTPDIQYEYVQKKINSMKAEVEKRVGKTGFVNLSYEKNFTNNIGFINFGVRLNFSFAQTSFSARHGNQSTSLVQSARGSLLFDRKSYLLSTNNQSNVGKGGVIISPFLDLNANGRRDTNEKMVAGLKLRINGGRIEHNDDGSLRVEGLEAFNSYLIELDKNSFDKIAWQIPKPTIRVTIEPNHFKRIEVPITVVGEASGMVYLKGNQSVTGISRILVNIYDHNAVIVGRTLSEADGYFTYFGLPPGSYTARVDTAQLRKLNFTCSPASLSINIAGSEEGVVADGFEFIIQSLSKDTGTIRNNQPLVPENIRQPLIQKEHTDIQRQQSTVAENKQHETDKKRNAKIEKSNAVTQNKQQAGLKKSKLAVDVKEPIVIQKNFHPLSEKKLLPAANQQKATTHIQKKSKPIIQGRPSYNMQKKKKLSLNRKQILQQYRLVAQQQQKARQKVEHLINEQQLLIQQNRQLIREIQQLRLQLQQLNLKNKQPSERKKQDNNIFKAWVQ